MLEHPMVSQINRTGYQREMIEKHVESSKQQASSQLFHIYECEDCIINFAVEQAAFEDQLFSICCPVCQDENIHDVASGEMKLRR
jgi:Zn finger protein HypA/HybF involved in hydrogenase expression